MTDHPGGKPFAAIPYPPKDWHFLQALGDGHVFVHKCGLRVIIDCEVKDDERRWVHVSVSRAKWIPSHEDVCKVKGAFIGDRYAYAVFPPRENYVNIHGNCLHLWALTEGDGRVLPEFSGKIGTAVTI